MLETLRDKLRELIDTISLKRKWLAIGLFLMGLFVGLVLFFPLDAMKSQILAQVSRNTGVDMVMERIRFGTGLGLGLRQGSLLALRGSNAKLRFQNGQSLSCDKLILAPHLLPMLWTEVKLGVACVSDDLGEIVVGLSARPFWNPSSAQATIFLDEVKLSVFENWENLSGLSGTLSGTLEARDIALPMRRPPNVEWTLTGNNINTPPLHVDLLGLPPMNLGPLSTKGTFTRSKLQINELKFGSKASVLEANLKASLTLDSMYLPSAGEFSGRIRSEPTFEKTQITDISLEQAFGPVTASGFREFRKPIQSAQSIIFGKPEPLNR